ncbi:MAG: trigger factor [Planctomycetota bacterium]|jgi:trigger factor
MNIDVQEVATCRQKISVTFDAQEVSSAFDKAYGDVKRQAQIPGFRQGHAPRRILERKFSDYVSGDVKNQLFHKGLVDSLKEKDLNPLGDPDVKAEDLEIKANEEFSFATEIDVRPTFELSEYKGLPLTEKVVKVQESELDERIAALQANFAENKETDGAAEAGNIVEGDVLFKVGDEEVFNQSGRAVRLEGTAIFGVEVGDVTEHLVGTKAGDEKTITFTTSDDYPREELRGQEATITIKADKVMTVELPELNDAFAERLGIDDLTKLREQFKSSMENERKSEARRGLEEALTEMLIEKHSFDLPEAVLEKQAEMALMQQRFNMMRMGATQEAMGDQEEDLKAESRQTAERQLRRMMIVDKIADKEEIQVNESDIHHHIQMLSQSYGTTPDKLIKDIQQRNGIGQLQEEIRDIKVTQFLLDQAEVTTEEIDAPAE